MGAGVPISGVIGKKEIMQQIAPLGNVYQAGTSRFQLYAIVQKEQDVI